MISLVTWLDQTLYPDARGNWDDELLRERILARLRPGHVLLDLGAGAGIVRQMNFRGRAGRVCGVDLDPRVAANPGLDEARIADVADVPYGDAVFDVVIADNLLEHLAAPQAVFAEVARVLKPGGLFLFKTPNKWHYVPTLARLTPTAFHRLVNRWRGRTGEDVFPTHYRANSKGSIERLAAAAGLRIVSLERIEGRPEYMRMSAPTYLAAAAYERLVNSTALLAMFRVVLIGILDKPGAPSHDRPR